MIVSRWYVGGGWQQVPNDLSPASIAGITILVFSIVACLAAATCCFIRRRPRILGRRFNGGRAWNYVARCDVGAQVPSPPPYDGSTLPLPPPYSPASSTDKPPDYEVVLFRNGQCRYQPVSERSSADSDTADSRQSHHSTV